MNIFKSRTATVLAASALLVGGTFTTAAASGLITSPDIANQTIQSVDVATGGVASSELRDGTVNVRDLSDSTLSYIDSHAGQAGQDGAEGPQGKTGERGEQGNQGEPGIQGEAGTNGVSGYWIEGPEARWSGANNTTTATCPDGKVALGGGFTVESIHGGSAVVNVSAPVFVSQTKASGWTVSGDVKGQANVKAWVTCAAVQ